MKIKYLIHSDRRLCLNLELTATGIYDSTWITGSTEREQIKQKLYFMTKSQK